MLNENIRNLRKSKGLSQEELAIRLNVVRQTISKWEKGLSVPDSSMIISLAEELDTSVSTLLGETVQEECLDKENMKSISEKLEVINLQLAKRSSMRIHTVRYLLISLCAIITIIFIAFAAMNGEYLTYLVCPYDRNLPLYLSCTDPIRNDEQQRVGTDRNELFQRTLCPGIPGISDDGMCCYLCSISGRHPVFR